MLQFEISVRGCPRQRFVATTIVGGKEIEIGSAHLKKATSPSNRYSMYMRSGSLLELRRIYVDSEYRGQGVATALLNAIINVYGNSDIVLLVLPLASNGLNSKELKEFYGKFGFVRTNEFQETMIRRADV